MIEVNNSEQQVLIACVRASLAARAGSEDHTALAGAVQAVQDWSALVQQAKEQGLLGLVWYASTLVAFPEDISAALATFAQAQREDNTRRAQQLLAVLLALADAGIRAVPFKGPVLADAAYDDIGLRSFWDLDILLPPQDFERALCVLEKLGFTNSRHPASGYPFTRRQLRALWRYWGQEVYYRESDELSLEPHQALAPATLALDFNSVWRRVSPADWRGQKIWRLTPEDELLLLCIQGAKPYWENLKLPADLAHYLAAHPALDWIVIVERAREHGMLRLLLVSLLLVEALFGVVLPSVVRPVATADRHATRLCSALLHQASGFAYADTDVYRVSSYHLALRERYRDKLAYLWRTLTWPREPYYQMVHLPAGMFWGYRVLKVLSDSYVGLRLLWRTVSARDKNIR